MQLQINLQELVSEAIKTTVQTPHDPDINVSLALFQLGTDPVIYHHFGETEVYHPASLIKLFHAYIAKYKIQSNAVDFAREKIEDADSFASANHMDDVYEAIDAALRVSDNDALSYLMDYNSGLCSGPRLSDNDFAVFKEGRDAISQFFHERNYSPQLNIPGKCFSFAPYGREKQLSLEEEGLGRNSISIQDALQIMFALKTDFPDLLISMKRELGNEEDEQCQFIAKGLIDYKDQIKAYYSKAGWTSAVRHDVAYFTTVDGKEYIVAIMTKNLSHAKDLIPELIKRAFSFLND